MSMKKMAAPQLAAGEGNVDAELTEERKLVKTLNIDCETQDFDKAYKTIENEGKLKKPSSEAYCKVQKMISNLALIPAFILVAFLFYKFPAEFKQMWVLLSATLSVVLTSTFLGNVWESFLGVVGDGKLVVAIIFWSLFIELFAFGCLFLINTRRTLLQAKSIL